MYSTKPSRNRGDEDIAQGAPDDLNNDGTVFESSGRSVNGEAVRLQKEWN